MFRIMEGKYKGLLGEMIQRLGSNVKLKIETLDETYTVWLTEDKIEPFE